MNEFNQLCAERENACKTTTATLIGVVKKKWHKLVAIRKHNKNNVWGVRGCFYGTFNFTDKCNVHLDVVNYF